MTKSERRQRAHYKRKLSDWEAGRWTPPRGWAQMVCNRFPDLIESARDRVLGVDRANELRQAHNESVRPKIGQLIAGGSQIITDIDHDKGMIIYAPNTRWWRFKLKLRASVARLFRRFSWTSNA